MRFLVIGLFALAANAEMPAVDAPVDEVVSETVSEPIEIDMTLPENLDIDIAPAPESMELMQELQTQSGADLPRKIKNQLEGMDEDQKAHIEDNLKRYRERRARMLENLPAEKQEELKARREDKQTQIKKMWDDMPAEKRAAHRERMVESFKSLPPEEQKRLLKRMHKLHNEKIPTE